MKHRLPREETTGATGTPHDRRAYRVWFCPYCVDGGAVDERFSTLVCELCGRAWALDGEPVSDVGATEEEVYP